MEEANLSRIRENIELTERIIKERFEDAEDSQFIEKILRREMKDPQLVVDEVVMDYGSEKGGNFLSMLKRATVTGKWKFGADNKGASHRGFRQSLIIKRALLSDSQEDVFFGKEAFENEVAAYSIIVPIFQKMCLAREQLVPYPKCLFSGDDDRGNPMIVLEDLRELGFETAKRSLTFEECDLVVRKFANLHAISMVLRIVNRSEFDQCLAVINDYMYVPGRESNKTIFPSVFEFNLNGGLRSLKAHNEDGRLTKSIHFLERHLTNNQLYEVIARIVTREADENLLAICHGDSWCNNIMLRTELCDARIIDLQIMRYASPTIDLLHCIYSSMDVHSLNQYYPQLIANYQATLMATIATIAKPYLSLEGISDQIEHLKSLHTTELILERMRRDSIYGFGMLLILLPVLPGVAMGSCFTSKSQDGRDICPGSSYCTRLRDAVLAFEAMGVFQEEFL